MRCYYWASRTGSGRFLPQFVDPAAGPIGQQFLLLGLIYVALALITDGEILDDGTAVASYCNWNFVDAQLKVAVRRPKDTLFTVIEAEADERFASDDESLARAEGDR